MYYKLSTINYIFFIYFFVSDRLQLLRRWKLCHTH
nr:MAG TPA: hypothetical protein [Caudoviricetes sp.]